MSSTRPDFDLFRGQEESSNFRGDWKTEGGHYVTINSYFLGHWIGIVHFADLKVPSFWDKHGNSSNKKLNLLTKKRGDEVW